MAGVYVLALAAGAFGFAAWPGHPVWAIGVAMLLATGVVYVSTIHVDNGSMFDAYWSVVPPLLAWLLTDAALPEEASLTPRQIAVHVVVWLWAVRLTLNWARGWPGLDHEDWRYTNLYRDTPLPRWAVQLLAVELGPTVFVWLGCLSLYPALMLGDAHFGWLDGAALLLGLAATTIELVADEQMRAFARDRRPGDVMDRGLWRWSRHPNYFGELCFWLSLWLFAMAAAPAVWWTVVGPLTMGLMFVLASIPMLDRRSAERRPGFAAYAERTSSLVPWPPRVGDSER